MNLLSALLLGLAFAALLYYIAARRGADKFFWALMGFIFGPLALPFILLAKTPDRNQRSVLSKILGRRDRSQD